MDLKHIPHNRLSHPKNVISGEVKKVAHRMKTGAWERKDINMDDKHTMGKVCVVGMEYNDDTSYSRSVGTVFFNNIEVTL